MPDFYVGGNQVSDLYLGGNKLSAAYMAGNLIFSASTTPTPMPYMNPEYNFGASDILWSGNFANRQQTFRLFSTDSETPGFTGSFWKGSGIPGTGNGVTVNGSSRLPVYLFVGRVDPDNSGSSQIWIFNGTTVSDTEMPTAFSLTFTRGSNSFTNSYTLVPGSSTPNSRRFYQKTGSPSPANSATSVLGTGLGASENLRITVSNVSPSTASLEIVNYDNAAPFLTSRIIQASGRRGNTSLNNVVLGRDTAFGHTAESDNLFSNDNRQLGWDGLADMGIRIRVGRAPVNRYRWFGSGDRSQWDDVLIRFVNKGSRNDQWCQLDGRVFGVLESGIGGVNSIVEQGTSWTFDPYSDSEPGQKTATERSTFMRNIFNLSLNGGVVTGDNIQLEFRRRV